MKLDEIREILDLMREHELTEIEVEQDGLRIKLRKKRPCAAGGAATEDRGSMSRAAGTASTNMAPIPPPGGEVEPVPVAADLAVVTSPIVGTFYRSPDPSAPPFVDVGDTVKKGQVLCIIEAMKLMNEIDSEYDGQIVSVYVESGQSIQYGERLFAIRPA